MIVFYYQIKTLISFWCRRGLNPRFLIQLSETLPIELTGDLIFEINIYNSSFMSKGAMYLK